MIRIGRNHQGVMTILTTYLVIGYLAFMSGLCMIMQQLTWQMESRIISDAAMRYVIAREGSISPQEIEFLLLRSLKTQIQYQKVNKYRTIPRVVDVEIYSCEISEEGTLESFSFAAVYESPRGRNWKILSKYQVE